MLPALGILLALTLGSLAGYVVHWAMHQPWSGALYRSHMDHHQVRYPASNLYSVGRYRSSGLASGWLTFTPLIALTGAVILGILGILLRVDGWVHLVVLGLLVVLGWAHGYVHDAFHVSDHGLGRFAWFQRLRILHEPHHVDMTKNLGILWFGWDRLFRTFQRPPR